MWFSLLKTVTPHSDKSDNEVVLDINNFALNPATGGDKLAGPRSQDGVQGAENLSSRSVLRVSTLI